MIHATEVQRDSLSEIVDDQAEKIEALQARIAQLTLELDRLQPAKAMKPRKERDKPCRLYRGMMPRAVPIAPRVTTPRLPSWGPRRSCSKWGRGKVNPR